MENHQNDSFLINFHSIFMNYKVQNMVADAFDLSLKPQDKPPVTKSASMLWSKLRAYVHSLFSLSLGTNIDSII